MTSPALPVSSHYSPFSSLHIQPYQSNLRASVPILSASKYLPCPSTYLKRQETLQYSQYFEKSFKAMHYRHRKRERQFILNLNVKEDEKKCMDHINTIAEEILLERRAHCEEKRRERKEKHILVID